MSQFNFGSNADNTAATPNFGFGAKPAAPTFGNLRGYQPSGSITFGTPIASVAPTPQNTALSFGTAAPNLQGTGLNFGAQQPTSPGLAFGAQPSKPGGLNFGATAPIASTPSLSFGAATTPVASQGLSFGTPAPAATGGLSFGAPPPASSSAGFGLGTATSTGLFGTPIAASTAQPVSLGGLNYGPAATTSSSTGFTLSTTPATTAFNLGTSAASTGLSFGAPVGTSTANTGLNFGLGGPTATAPAPSLNFKTTSSAQTSTTPSLNFGFGTPAKTQATPTLTLGTVTSQPTSVGLGGIDSTLNKTGTVAAGRADTIAATENSVPNEILQTIENFKQFVKDQKTFSSDVSRGSARPFLKVGEDIDLLNSVLSEVGNELQRNQQLADRLKHDSAKCLHDAEMAQRTSDTPPGLQFENTAPMQYFIDLVNGFEQDLQAVRLQIDVTDKHIQSLHEPRFLTSQELALGMRRLHDTFVALAGRLQSVHTQVESQKEQYLNLRKYILKDPTNIFSNPTKEEQALDLAIQGLTNFRSAPGPTPFASVGSVSGMMLMAPQQSPAKPPVTYPTNNTWLSFGTPTNNYPTSSLLGSSGLQFGPSASLFGNTTPLGQSPVTDASGFQLQNPPLGNKRGKR